MKILNEEFYARDTLVVARELLGKTLCRRLGEKIMRGKIVETEAYTQEDPACHAFKGLRPRCKSLFEAPGTAYVYLIYGIYNCFNISTFKKGYGCGVLIRALEPLENIFDTNGPSKICKEMSITRELDGADLKSKNSPVWIENGAKVTDDNIIQTVRVGIKLAVDYPWRFYVKNNRWVSKP